MATISSLTSSSSNSNVYGSQSKGIGGLVSGLNTDELLDGMTIGTRTKIASQKQQKSLLSWKTDAYRSISDKLVSFANSFTSYSSTTNLYSANFYNRNLITAKGSNSDAVTVSGKVSGSQQMSVLGVKQLAQNASFTTTEALSNNAIETGTIDFGDKDICTVAGKSFNVKYGNTVYSVTMPMSEANNGLYVGVANSAADKADGIVGGLEKALAQVDIGGGKTLGSVMGVTAQGETLNFKNLDTAGNGLKIVGGDTELLTTLGIVSGGSTIIDKSIGEDGLGAVSSINADDLKKNTTIEERMLGKSITFTYNGTKQVITFDDKSKLTAGKFEEYLQGKLDSAFGKGRIDVAMDGSNKLALKTVLPSGADDPSSVLYMSSSSTGLMGKAGVFGIASGSSNKLNMTDSLENSGLKGMSSTTLTGDMDITINGVKIDIKYEKGKTSLQDIVNAINANEEAGVKMSYQTNSDSFTLVSTQSGASGAVEIGGGGDLSTLEKLLFGKSDGTLNGTTVKGQDAIIRVDYDGEGGAAAQEIYRSSNSFNLDGMTIVANKTFGYDASGTPVASTEAIKFEASVDTDKMVSAIKSMVDAYNELVEISNTSVQEKRDRKYPPLTDEQKADMSEKEIEAWDKKAKAGMLFGDSAVSGLTSDLRYVFLNVGSEGLSLADIGITVSSDWKDNGKITLDETKLKTALGDDPEKIQKLFTEELTDGKLNTGGIMSRMKAITDKYAATTGATKGILIEKAGNIKSPSSILSNTLQKQMDNIDDVIKNLESKLTTERTRYQNQFTQLEVMMQKLNAQSGWLSEYSGS